VHVSFAKSEEEALRQAHEQWRSNAFGGSLLWDVPLASELDAAARFVRPDDLRESVRISPDIERQRAWLEEDLAMGFERVYVHQVGRDQNLWIDKLSGALEAT
jgi:hypothetical protein